jgi:hypothetical protein
MNWIFFMYPGFATILLEMPDFEHGFGENRYFWPPK